MAAVAVDTVGAVDIEIVADIPIHVAALRHQDYMQEQGRMLIASLRMQKMQRYIVDDPCPARSKPGIATVGWCTPQYSILQEVGRGNGLRPNPTVEDAVESAQKKLSGVEWEPLLVLIEVASLMTESANWAGMKSGAAVHESFADVDAAVVAVTAAAAAAAGETVVAAGIELDCASDVADTGFQGRQ